MPRSSKHKSRRDYSDSDEDVKMKEKEKEKESVVKVTKDLSHSASGEKRKLSSQSKESKDLSSGYGNGDVSSEYVSSKRRKEKAEASSGGGVERWNGAAVVDSEMKGESSKIDVDNKGSKGKETKSSSDSKSKNSKKEGGGSVVSLVEKEESKSGRVESKRKSEKDSGVRKEGKDSKEKERGADKDKKGQESKRDDGDNVKKQGSQSGDVSDEKQSKKGRENPDWSIQTEVQNLDLDKETEKRTRKRREVSGDQDKHEADLNESDDRRLSSRSERTKDEKPRHEKHKEYKEDGDKDVRHRDDRCREVVDKDRKRRDDKYRDDGDRDSRRRDDKYLEDADKDSKRRDDKYRDDGDRDTRRKDDRHRDDDERDIRRRDDKYREGGDGDNKHRDDKYREYGEKDGRHDEDRYHEDVERDDRQRDFKYREDSERDKRRKDEKHREDLERHGRCKDGDEADESDKKRRLGDAKYANEFAPRDYSGDRSDSKRSRNEGHASDLHLRKSIMHDHSPGFDDRTRYKDELGRRRTHDKEDLGDIRSRSTKEQRSEAEKRSTSSARVESVTDRGRSTSRTADVELTPKKSRWRTSPGAGPPTTRDNYRMSKQEDPKYRDYPYEDRTRHGATSRDYAGSGGSIERISSSRSTEKLMQKDDIFIGEFSTERRVKSDVRSSPLQIVDRSPPASNERRHFSRSDVRRSLDVEESTQRSGGSRDVKEGRGNRDFAGDVLAGDELSQMDGDNISVSSPFVRGSHLSGSSKSALPPPPPFRSGVDSPLTFSSLDDDSRGKSTNRHRRINDPTIGRMPGNAWKGVPNWPSPLANGFLPFQQGPPPVGFHPAMQQFPGPPIFGVRPSMDLPGVPYHMPDGDRFSGHGRPMGWRTPLDDSCVPPLHGWDANNFGEEGHLYVRPDWDQTRAMSNNSRSWETCSDVWKGPMRGTSVELPSGSQKEVSSIQGPGDSSFAAQSAQQAQSEQKQAEDAESNDISQSNSVPGRSTPEDLKSKPEEQPIEVKPSRKEETRVCNVYLSKLDISADLTEPVLFDQCTSLMDVDQNMTSDVDISKILFLEGVVESNITLPIKFSSASLAATLADSVFQRAILLYKKRREEIKLMTDGKCSFNGLLGESYPAPKLENSSPDHGRAEDSALVDDGPAEDGDKGVDLPASSEEVVGLSQTTCQEECEPTLNPTEKSDLPPPMVERVVMKGETVLDVAEESKIGENLSLEEAGRPDTLSPPASKDLMSTGTSILDDIKDGKEKLVDAKCGPVPHPDVSSEVFEAVMPESIESESVNLSQIHHSPESTH